MKQKSKAFALLFILPFTSLCSFSPCVMNDCRSVPDCACMCVCALCIQLVDLRIHPHFFSESPNILLLWQLLSFQYCKARNSHVFSFPKYETWRSTPASVTTFIVPHLHSYFHTSPPICWFQTAESPSSGGFGAACCPFAHSLSPRADGPDWAGLCEWAPIVFGCSVAA